ncbi:MAG: hypothetical protein ACRDPL_16095, partial [Propionibacteriaceae bacterium]
MRSDRQEWPLPTSSRLARVADAGLRRVEDVLALDDAALARLVGPRDAVWLAERVRGMDDAE